MAIFNSYVKLPEGKVPKRNPHLLYLGYEILKKTSLVGPLVH